MDRIINHSKSLGVQVVRLIRGKKMSKKWIQKAIKHPGGLHKALHVPEGEKIPANKMAKGAKSSSPHVRKMVALAKTLKKL